MITSAAVEAAAKAIDASKAEGCGCCAYPEFTAEEDKRADELDINVRALLIAQEALEAAAPHMLEDKRGDGDYRPGWDDRKTLSSLWQEHAPLPDEGLSERVYEALIAVATWGYQQRKDEEL